MAALTGKWGRGAAAGASAVKEHLLPRPFNAVAALRASGSDAVVPCDFEVPAVRVLCDRHSSAQLAIFHCEFLREAARAEGLYLNFSHFLLQQMIKLCEKTLP